MTTAIQPAGKNPAYRVWRGVPEEERQQRLQGVIERFVNDEKLADIAQSLNISHSALNMALLEYAEDDWRRAQVARALTRLEKSQELRDSMERAETPLSHELLSLARDAEKSAQWQLERLLRRLYGQEQAVTNSQVIIQLGSGFLAPQQKHDISTEDAQVIDVAPNPADRQSVGGSAEGVGGSRNEPDRDHPEGSHPRG